MTRDRPEWLGRANASVLKVTPAVATHITFLLSAIAIAYTDKIMSGIAERRH